MGKIPRASGPPETLRMSRDCAPTSRAPGLCALVSARGVGRRWAAAAIACLWRRPMRRQPGDGRRRQATSFFGAKKRATRDGALRGNRRERALALVRSPRCAGLRVATACVRTTCGARSLLAGRPTRILLLSQACPCTYCPCCSARILVLMARRRRRRDETFLCTV